MNNSELNEILSSMIRIDKAILSKYDGLSNKSQEIMQDVDPYSDSTKSNVNNIISVKNEKIIDSKTNITNFIVDKDSLESHTDDIDTYDKEYENILTSKDETLYGASGYFNTSAGLIEIYSKLNKAKDKDYYEDDIGLASPDYLDNTIKTVTNRIDTDITHKSDYSTYLNSDNLVDTVASNSPKISSFYKFSNSIPKSFVDENNNTIYYANGNFKAYVSGELKYFYTDISVNVNDENDLNEISTKLNDIYENCKGDIDSKLSGDINSINTMANKNSSNSVDIAISSCPQIEDNKCTFNIDDNDDKIIIFNYEDTTNVLNSDGTSAIIEYNSGKEITKKEIHIPIGFTSSYLVYGNEIKATIDKIDQVNDSVRYVVCGLSKIRNVYSIEHIYDYILSSSVRFNVSNTDIYIEFKNTNNDNNITVTLNLQPNVNSHLSYSIDNETTKTSIDLTTKETNITCDNKIYLYVKDNVTLSTNYKEMIESDKEYGLYGNLLSLTSKGSNLLSGLTKLTEIDLRSFENIENNLLLSTCMKLSSVIVSGSNVKNVGISAFSYCNALNSVDFTNCTSLETIGSYAFYSCDSLSSVDFPSSIVRIGAHALDNCQNYKTIKDSAFKNYTKLQYIALPDALKSIGTSAFYNCDSLLSIDFSNCSSLMTISSYAFDNCDSLLSIDFSSCSSLTTISSYAFSDCDSLSAVILPSSLTDIGNNAFKDISACYISAYQGCMNWQDDEDINTSIKEYGALVGTGCNATIIGLVVYDGGLLAITSLADDNIICFVNRKIVEDNSTNKHTFDNNVSIVSSIKYRKNENDKFNEIENGVTINKYETIYIRGSELSTIYNVNLKGQLIYEFNALMLSSTQDIAISSTPLSLLKSGEESYDDINHRMDYAYNLGYMAANNSKVKSINIDGITYVPRHYAYNDDNLESLTLGGVITGILQYAFNNCDSLSSVDFSSCSSLTTIYNYAFRYCSSLLSVDFRGCSSLQTIGNYAFSDCSSLSSIVFPSSLQYIGYNAFHNCDSLSSIDFSSCSSLTTIYNYAFCDCPSLSSVDFTNCSSLTTIGECAFSSCDSLSSVDFSSCSLLKIIDEWTFFSCYSLSSIILPSSLTTIDDWAFYNCSSLLSLDFSSCSSLQRIGENAFLNCSSLLSVDFTNCTLLKIIDEGAFRYCDSLSSVDFTNCSTLQTIDDGAFRYCSSLSSVDFSSCSSLTTIGAGAFGDCDSLSSIDFSSCSSLTTISGYAFDNCDSLSSVDFTNCSLLKTIDSYAFNSCTSLLSIDFSSCSSLTTIYNYAFSDCDSLSSIILPSSLTDIGNNAFKDISACYISAYAGCKDWYTNEDINNATSGIQNFGALVGTGCSAFIILAKNDSTFDPDIDPETGLC